jgi:hypothetical protein
MITFRLISAERAGIAEGLDSPTPEPRLNRRPVAVRLHDLCVTYL